MFYATYFAVKADLLLVIRSRDLNTLQGWAPFMALYARTLTCTVLSRLFNIFYDCVVLM